MHFPEDAPFENLRVLINSRSPVSFYFSRSTGRAQISEFPNGLFLRISRHLKRNALSRPPGWPLLIFRQSKHSSIITTTPAEEASCRLETFPYFEIPYFTVRCRVTLWLPLFFCNHLPAVFNPPSTPEFCTLARPVNPPFVDSWECPYHLVSPFFSAPSLFFLYLIGRGGKGNSLRTHRKCTRQCRNSL